MTTHAAISLGHVAALGLMSLAFSMNTHAASERILFDFRASTNTSAWQIVNDDVMGGVSTSRFQILTNGGAIFSGVVSLENNGGFASVWSSPARHDLTGCGCFVIRVRGDGRRYKFTARTETGFDAPLYQCAFLTKRGEWEEHRLAFKDFVPTFRGRILTGVPPLDPGKIASVGLHETIPVARPGALLRGEIRPGCRRVGHPDRQYVRTTANHLRSAAVPASGGATMPTSIYWPPVV